VRKVLPWLALAIAVIWIIQNPAGAAADIKALFTDATTFASHL
jgi:hypothetical protein